MKRRNFFAALLAPLVARFVPKPTTTLTAASLEEGTVVTVPSSIVGVDWADSESFTVYEQWRSYRESGHVFYYRSYEGWQQWPSDRIPILRIEDPVPFDPRWPGVILTQEMTREEFATRYPSS